MRRKREITRTEVLRIENLGGVAVDTTMVSTPSRKILKELFSIKGLEKDPEKIKRHIDEVIKNSSEKEREKFAINNKRVAYIIDLINVVDIKLENFSKLEVFPAEASSILDLGDNFPYEDYFIVPFVRRAEEESLVMLWLLNMKNENENPFAKLREVVFLIDHDKIDTFTEAAGERKREELEEYNKRYSGKKESVVKRNREFSVLMYAALEE